MNVQIISSIETLIVIPLINRLSTTDIIGSR